MAIPLFRVVLLFAFSCCFFINAPAQKLTGIWRGYFITDGGEQYKYEVQINQSPTKRLTGVTYSYLDTRFYGKATFTGAFNTTGKQALVEEIKTVELRMSGGSMACIMKCNIVYSRSGKEEFLEGTYTSSYEKNNKLLGIERGGDCGGGKLYLRKVPTSDFYVEPFLRTNPKIDKPENSIAKKTPSKTNTTTKTTVPQKKPAVIPPVTATKKPPVKKETITVLPKRDTVKKAPNITVINEVPSKTIEKPVLKLPTFTRSRTNELIQTLTVQSNDIEVRLYDNGEIDDDTISVYLDNKLVLSSKRLSAAPLSLSINMEQDGEEHVLVMVAENLGRIPPNTSLMIVYDGERRHEVRVTSTEQKNAMIRFKYKRNS
jgi:hypothetical protein